MKRVFVFLGLTVIIASMLCLSGCRFLISDYLKFLEALEEAETVQTQDYVSDEDSFADAINRMRYTELDLVFAANTLFMDDFEVVSSVSPTDVLEPMCYELKCDSLPFTFNAYSEVVVYEEGGKYYGYPHAWCDYYAQSMKYHSEEAQKVAEENGLEITIEGQDAYVTVNSFDQLEAVYNYLYSTNTLYNFTVDEGWITGLFRDMRARPSLHVKLDKLTFGSDDEVIQLYYTINHRTYNYSKSQLLPAMQEKYIEMLDSKGKTDPLVTDSIRKDIVHPELTEMRINGVPLEPLDCGDYILDPVVRFDYNWQHGMYLADLRICAPSENYDAPPDDAGDDRNFKYLVELLGGTYSSEISVEYTDTVWYSKANWWLGGNEYGAGSTCQEHIPTDTVYSKGERGLPIGSRFSKEIWGLEDGYDASDYFVRLNPDELGMILGLDVEINYEEGYVNYIMPDGYADAAPPVHHKEYFDWEYVYDTNENGVSYQSGTSYTIYDRKGNVLLSDSTDDFYYVYLDMITENIVELKHSGSGTDWREYINIDTGELSARFPYTTITNGDFIVYYDYTNLGLCVIQKIFDDSARMAFALEDLPPAIPNPIVGGHFSGDGKSVTIIYYDKDYLDREITVDISIK